MAAHAHGDLDPRLRELIRVRASQLNGCAYCLSMHNEDARKAGEDQIRLDVLAGWREAGDLFDERERAALALVDGVTLMRDSGDAYDAAAGLFTAEELDGVLWQAIAINAWNRQAVTTRSRPEPLPHDSSSGARAADLTSMAGTSEASSAISDDRFRSLVEDLPAVTYIADFVGTFTLRYVSPQIEKLFGYSRAELDRGRRAPGSTRVHPDDRDRIVAEAEACIAAALPFDFEYRLITADGRERWIWEKTAVQRDADGQPLAVNGVMIDVTELHRAQDALLDEAEGRAREREHYEGVLRRQAAEHRHHALHDDLTGLPNRRSLYERLAAEMINVAAGEEFSLLLVDLDRFKEVNDVLGHQSGDDLLRQVAARFANEVRSRGPARAARAATSSPSSSAAGRAPRPGWRSPAGSVARCVRSSSSAASPSTSRRRSASPATRSTAPTRPRCCAAPTPRCTRRRS